MADVSNASSAPSSSRDILAIVVFAFSIVALAAISIVVVWVNPAKSETVFSALLPLLGTWVGTVLAFYFSRDNFEAASRSLNQVVAKLTPEERLNATPVRKAMLPWDHIKSIQLEAGKGESTISIPAIEELLKPPYTRAPIFDDKRVVRAVLHQSLFYRYLNDRRKAGEDPAQKTLADLLADPVLKDMATKLAFCRVDATLAEAKQAMEKVPQCQDVFVTATGRADEPVVGWLMNVDITRNIFLPGEPSS